MSIKEYLENLTRLKNLAVDRFGNLTSLEKDAVESSYDWLVDNLEIKKGEVVVDEELSRLMNEFVKVVVDIIENNKGFQSKIGNFLSDLKNIQANNKKFHATTNNFNIETAGVNDVQKAVVGEIIEQYTGNGLNQHFAAPLKDAVYRNILSGANMQEIKQVLQNYILSGADQSGKLQSYLHNTAIQAADSYTGAINQELVKTFTFTGYIISGSLIETSSKQCIYAVETSEDGYLTFKDWEKVLDIARNNPKAKLIEGTTVKNLPLNKLHWGCRHDFTPIVRKEEKKKDQSKIERQTERIMTRAKVAGPEVDNLTKGIAKKNGAITTPINFKSKESIERKANSDYNGNVNRVTDSVRTTIISPDENISAIVSDLKANKNVISVRQQKAETDPLGYSGNLLLYQTRSGLTSEIQVNSPEMIYAKELEKDSRLVLGDDVFNKIKNKFKVPGGLGHAYYEEYRVLSVTDPGTEPRRKELEVLSKKYYNIFR